MTIFDLFEGLVRCAPGDGASLRRAMAGLRPAAVVLDAGAGRGADLGDLAALVLQGRIVAVEAAEPFVAHLRRAHPAVQAVAGDMADPPGGPFDAVWSGGAIYTVGVTAALRAWARHLAPGGFVAFTDLCLKRDPAAPEVAAFFAAEGVPMRGAAALAAEVAAAGYRMEESFWLPDAAWEAYYGPLDRRIAALPPPKDAGMRALLEGFRAEIALWRLHGADYGYLCCRAVPA